MDNCYDTFDNNTSTGTSSDANVFAKDKNGIIPRKIQSDKERELEKVKLINSVSRVAISSLTPKTFFERYQKTGTPVIITGLLEDECDWNLDYLCQRIGDREFVFRNYGRSKYKLEKRKWTGVGSGVALQSMCFNDYAQLLRNRKAHEQDIYLGKCSLKYTSLADTPSLKKIGVRLGLTKPATDLYMYMGPAGHTSGLHYDSADGTLMQLHGAKKLVLFPPTQTYNLYPLPIYIHLRYGLKLRSWFSQVDLQRPDLQAFPKFQEALQHKREVILHPGETLYIPAGWWHEVIALGDEMVCSVSRFWRVYPLSRAVFSWSRWRAILGFLCAIPYTFLSFVGALFSDCRKQKIAQVWHRI